MKIVRILGSEAAILVVLVGVKDSVYIVYIWFTYFVYLCSWKICVPPVRA